MRTPFPVLLFLYNLGLLLKHTGALRMNRAPKRVGSKFRGNAGADDTPASEVAEKGGLIFLSPAGSFRGLASAKQLATVGKVNCRRRFVNTYFCKLRKK